MRHTIFLFGEAEKGEFCSPLVCKSMPQLVDLLGNPPHESRGISFAVQVLLYKRELIYFRVREEGFSSQDYMRGLRLLQKKGLYASLSAIGMPGMGDPSVINPMQQFCAKQKTLLILSPGDLYDYLTAPNT